MSTTSPPTELPRTAPLSERRRGTGDSGLTILEVMIVLVILSIAGVVVGMQVTQQFDRAKVDLARLQLRQIQNALTLFQLDTNRSPTAEEGIAALVSPPDGVANWRGPYVRTEELLVDPWGQTIRYAFEGEHYVITSFGSDRKAAGEGVAADLTLADGEIR